MWICILLRRFTDRQTDQEGEKVGEGDEKMTTQRATKLGKNENLQQLIYCRK